LHHKSSGRFHPEIVNKPPPRKVEELIPLPLPRNLLLLQMMDAAEREKKAKHAKTKGMQLNQTESSESIITLSYSDESESEDSNFSLDNDKVKVGVDAISSAAGTYAVSDENGVRISRERPHRFQERWPTSNSSGSLCRDSKINFVMSTEKKVDSGFQKSAELVIPLSENTDTLEIITKHDKNDASGDVPELTNDFEKSDIDDDEMNGNYLKYGVRVQVVDMQHGHAKLARNRGYVAVSNSRLVKVGGPQDAACEIEGLLNSAVSQTQVCQNFVHRTMKTLLLRRCRSHLPEVLCNTTKIIIVASVTLKLQKNPIVYNILLLHHLHCGELHNMIWIL